MAANEKDVKKVVREGDTQVLSEKLTQLSAELTRIGSQVDELVKRKETTEARECLEMKFNIERLKAQDKVLRDRWERLGANLKEMRR